MERCSKEMYLLSWKEKHSSVKSFTTGQWILVYAFCISSEKVKLRVWHNPSVKVIDIWTGSYWIAYFLWGYNLCSCGCCVWLAVEPNWEHTHHLDTLSRWQQINSLIAHRWQIQFKQFITCWGMVLQLFVRVFEKIIANDKLRWIFFNNKKILCII